jgi:spore coat protein U-like protein
MTLFSRPRTLAAIVLMGLSVFSASARAQTCTISFEQMNFGSLRTVALSSKGTISAMTANCVGQPNQIIRVCPSFQNTELMHATDPKSKLRLNLFSDAGYQMPMPVGMDVALDASGNGRETLSIYGKVAQGGSLKSGQYHAALTVFTTVSYLATGALCAVNPGSQRMPAVASRAAPPTVKAVAAKR